MEYIDAVLQKNAKYAPIQIATPKIAQAHPIKIFCFLMSYLTPMYLPTDLADYIIRSTHWQSWQTPVNQKSHHDDCHRCPL